MSEVEMLERRGSGRMASLLLGLSVLVAALPSTARAEGPEAVRARTGVYVGLYGVYAAEDFDRSFDDSAGLEARVGYRFWPHLAAEFRFEWLEGFDSTGVIPGLEDPSLNPSRGDIEIDTYQVMLNAKLFASTGTVQPYVVAGMGALIANTELRDEQFKKPFDVDAGFAARFGAGLDGYVTDHWVIEIEGAYLVTTGAVSGQRYGTVSVGVQYRF